MLSSLGEYQESADLWRPIVTYSEEEYGPSNFATLSALSNLAAALRGAMDWQNALAACRLAQERTKPDDPSAWHLITAEGTIYLASGDTGRAEPLFLEAYQGLIDLGVTDSRLAYPVKNLVGLYDQIEGKRPLAHRLA